MPNLPASLIVALGLTGCGAGELVSGHRAPTVGASGKADTANQGETGVAETGVPPGETGDSGESGVGPCLDTWSPDSDTADSGVGPCLAPPEESGETADTGDTSLPHDSDSDSGLGPCLSVQACLCGCGDKGVPLPMAASAGLALLIRRRGHRTSVTERVVASGVLPPDVAARLRSRDS